MDVEFAVQFLVLAHSAAHPELIANVGNIALLQRGRGGRPAAGRRRHGGRRRLPRAAPRAAPGPARRAADPGRRRPRWPSSAMPCSPCGERSSRTGLSGRVSDGRPHGRRRPGVAGSSRGADLGGADGVGHRRLAAADRLARRTLDWQPGRARAEPWRAFSAVAVHYSGLHLAANLAGTVLVAALGRVARLPATLRRRLGPGLAADPARPAAATGAAALRRPVGRAACRCGGRGAAPGAARARRRRRASASPCWPVLAAKVLLRGALGPAAAPGRRLGHRDRAGRPRQRRDRRAAAAAQWPRAWHRLRAGPLRA